MRTDVQAGTKKPAEVKQKPPAASVSPKNPSVIVKGGEGTEIIIGSNPTTSGEAYFPEFGPKIYVQQSNEIERNGGMGGTLWQIDSIGETTPTVSIDNSSPTQTQVTAPSNNWQLWVLASAFVGLFLFMKVKK